MPVRFIEVINELKKRGQEAEALLYQIYVTSQLFILQGIPEEKVMQMTVDEIEEAYNLPQKPWKYHGWNFWWGEAAFQ